MVDTEWHLDRKVPIALILTIVLQTSAAAWFAASLSERVGVLERDVTRQRSISDGYRGSIRALENEQSARSSLLNSIQTDIAALKNGQIETNKLLQELLRR